MDDTFEPTLPMMTSVFATKNGQQGHDIHAPCPGRSDSKYSRSRRSLNDLFSMTEDIEMIPRD